jgi:hypothetical protein
MADKTSLHFAHLTTDEQRELRRIWHELDNFPFIERTWKNREGEVAHAPGHGSGRGARRVKLHEECPFVPGEAGAPVYHDIQRGRAGSRAQVKDAIGRFILGKPATAIVTRALDVVRRRLDGDPSVLRAMLPAEAGDDPITPEREDMRELESHRTARQLSRRARKAWDTMVAKGIRRRREPRPPASADRRAAALKAWATRRGVVNG